MQEDYWCYTCSNMCSKCPHPAKEHNPPVLSWLEALQHGLLSPIAAAHAAARRTHSVLSRDRWSYFGQ